MTRIYLISALQLGARCKMHYPRATSGKGGACAALSSKGIGGKGDVE